MSLINTNAYGDLDLQGYSYYYYLGGDSAAKYAYTFSTNQGNYTFIPDDFISKGIASGTKQYYSNSFLNKDTLSTLYTKYQPLDFGDFKGFDGADSFYDRLKASGYGTSGVLIPESALSNFSAFKSYTLDRYVGNVQTGAIQGMGEKDGQLVYIPKSSGADSATAWIQNDGKTYAQWMPELKWYQKLAQDIAKIPLFPELGALAVAAIPGGSSYAPYVYAALKGLTLGAQGVDPLKAGLMVGVNLAAQNLAANSPFAKTIGSTFGATSDVMQLAVGKAVIGATVNGLRASLSGGDVTKAMLDGAVTAGASSMVPELTKSVLGSNYTDAIKKISDSTNLTQNQVQTVIASSFVAGISSEIKGGNFADAFKNNLVAAGVGQSLANEVGNQVGNNVSPELRQAIVTGVSTVAGTAAVAAINGQDVTKALEANLPSTIYSTMNTYYERQKNEATAVKEGWKDYDQKLEAQSKWGANTTPIDYKSKEQFVADAKEFTYDGSKASSVDQAKKDAIANGYNTFYGPDQKIYTIGGQSLTSMDTFVQAMNPSFDPAAYKKINNLGADVNAAEHYLDIGQYKNLPVSFDQYVDKTFSVLPEYKEVSAKDFYKEERDAAIAAAKAGDFSKVDEIAKYINKSFTTADEATKYLKDAYAAAGMPDKEPTARDLDMVRGKSEVNAYTIAQAVAAIGATTFDGTKYATPALASEAAKAAGYNTFEAKDGNTYKVMSTIDEANIRANVEDQKTFRDAFAMARAQLGDGKTFTWNGKQYTTNILPADTYDASRSGSIESAATLAYANGKMKFIGPDGKSYTIPPEARAALENAVNQSPAETARLLRQSVTPQQDEYLAETQRLMEKPGRGTMDNISAMTSQILGTTQRGMASFLTNAGETYAAITGDLNFDNAATRLGRDIENYAKSNDVYGLDVQKNRINQALSLANQTDSWWEKTKIIGNAIAKNPIGFFDIAGSEVVQELPETAIQIGIALATGGAGVPAIMAVSGAGTFLESFGSSAKSAYDQAKAKGDSDEVAANKAYLNATVSTLLEIGPEMIADKALVAPLMKSVGDSLIGATAKYAGSVATGAASEFVSSLSQSYAEQLIVNPATASFSKAVTDGIFGASIGGVAQGALSLPGYAIQSSTIIGKDYGGNDVSIADLISGGKVLDSSTVNPNLVIGRTENNNELTLGGAMTMMPSYNFNEQILTTYAPKVYANNAMTVGRDALGNEVTYGTLKSQVTPNNTYANVFNTVVNPSIEAKVDAQKVYLTDQFNKIGFTPTNTQLDNLIVADPKGSQALTDTAKTFAFDQIASQENYKLTPNELNRLIAPDSKIQTAEQFRDYVNPLAVTEQEAKKFFEEQGYTKPTQEQIDDLMGMIERDARERAITVADPYYIDAGEIKAAAAAEGFFITDEEAEKLAREGNEANEITAYRTQIDPLAVNETEAQEFFKQFNYEPSADELRQFVASKPEDEIRADMAAYVNPRQVTLEELQAAAAAEGYQLSPEDIKKYSGQIEEEPTIAAFKKYADPLATIESEARDFLASYGYTNPTQEDVNKIVGQILEEKARTQASVIADPNVLDVQEVLDAAKAEGYDFTEEQAKQLARETNEAEALNLFRSEIDPLAVTTEEAQAFFDAYGYKPNAEELALFTKSKPEAEIQPTVYPYVDPRQMTQAEAEAVFGRLGYKLSPDEINQFVRSGQDIQQELVAQDIQKYVDPRMVTTREVLDAYRNLGIDQPAPQDVTKYVGQFDQASIMKDITSNIDAARYNALQQQIAQQTQAAKQQNLAQKGMEFLGQAATAAPAAISAVSQAPEFLKPFITSTTKQEGFESALQPFLKEVAQTDYTKPEFGSEMQQTAEVRDNTQQGETVMPSYFTYGNQSDIDRLFTPFSTAGTGFFPETESAAGGLATPLMAAGGSTRYGRYAGGGLPVVEHSGKARLDFRSGAAVTGPGDGQSDDIPAMLADGEFVIPADVVAALGNGSTKAGSDKLYDMMHSIRSYHRAAKPQDLPPQAKMNPLDYLKRPAKRARR